MWQCKHCKERYVEKPAHHLCVTDELDKFFKGRRVLLQPLLQNLLAKLNRFADISVSSDRQMIVLQTKVPFAYIHVSDGSLDIFVSLPEDKPISPKLKPAGRLQIANASHYFSLRSVADITPDLLQTLTWTKEFAEKNKDE